MGTYMGDCVGLRAGIRASVGSKDILAFGGKFDNLRCNVVAREFKYDICQASSSTRRSRGEREPYGQKCRVTIVFTHGFMNARDNFGLDVEGFAMIHDVHSLISGLGVIMHDVLKLLKR